MPNRKPAANDAETLLFAIAETMPGSIWAADVRGALDFSTHGWGNLASSECGQACGDGWAAFVHPDDLPATGDKWRHSIATGSPFDNRFRVRGHDGLYRWFLARAIPLRDTSGTIIRWAGINVDVDDQVQTEHTLCHLNATLERRIALALAEREEAEGALRQAQRMEAIGQLTGGIAHDFNNMLQGVIGSLDLIQRRIGQGRYDEIDRFVTLAGQGADRAAALTAKLLSFARRQALIPQLTDPADIVVQMAEMVRCTVGPCIEVELDVIRDLQVRCDVSGLENAILNLAINARDAMPDGGRLVLSVGRALLTGADIAGHDGLYPGDYVRIALADTGTGMTADVASRVFDPFFTTKPIGQGTGLGLSQLYGFVRQSGGLVQLVTAEGRGTMFSMLLPAERSESEGGLAGPDQAGPAARVDPAGRG